MLVVSSVRPDGWAAVRFAGPVVAGVHHAVLRLALLAHARGGTRGVAVDLAGVAPLPDASVEVLADTVLLVAEGGCWVDVSSDDLVTHRRLAAHPVLANVLAPYRRRRTAVPAAA